MKKIKIKILGHPITDTFGYSYVILSTLQKYYDVELSESPDYLFYHDSTFEHYKYENCIKIFYTGENISPNFNQCDYALSYDYLTFEDRHYRLPAYSLFVFYNQEELTLAGKEYLTKQPTITQEDLKQKTEFCSFIYSNYRAEKERRLIFNTLSSYKLVNAAGAYLNNTGGKKVKNKLEYELKHKFSVAFENSSRSGYTTEKIVSALVAKTIPIYWGNPNIHKEFNARRFINCHDYTSFEDVLKKVKELDENDDMYLQMVNEPFATKDYDFKSVRDGFDIFLKKIIDQPKEEAKRRTINPVKAIEIQHHEEVIAKDVTRRALVRSLVARLYKPFKSIKILERVKQEFFKIK